MSLKDSVDGSTKIWKVDKVLEPYYRGGKIEVSEDSNRLVTLLDGRIKLVHWDAQTTVESLASEEDESVDIVTSFCISPNGKEICLATSKFAISLWDLETKQCKRVIKAHRMPILAMEFDPSGTLVATASADRTVKIWDVTKGFCTHSFSNHTDIVKVVTFHPDGERWILFSTSDDHTVCVYDLRESACVAQFREHVSSPSSLAVSADGYILASAGRDKVLNFYDLRTLTHLKTVPLMEELEAIVCLDDDLSKAILQNCGIPLKKATTTAAVVVTAGEQGVLKFGAITMSGKDESSFAYTYLFQIHVSAAAPSSSSTPVAAENLEIARLKSVQRLVYLQTAQQLVACTNDFNIAVYTLYEIAEHTADLIDSASAASTSTSFYQQRPTRVLIGSHGDILDMVRIPTTEGQVSDDYDLALVTNSPQLRLMNRAFDCRVVEGHQDIILAVDVSDDGKWLATASKDKTCRVWSTAAIGSSSGSNSGCVAVAMGHTEAVGAVSIAHNPATYLSHRAFLVSGGGDKILKRWVLPVHLLDITNKKSNFMTLSPSQSIRAHDKDINCVVTAPNDSIVASASQDKTIKLWQGSDLSLLATLSGHKRGVWKVRFSPVDKVLLSCSGDRTVKLWSLSDYSLLRTLEGHTAGVLNAVFLQQATQIMTASADGLLRLWNVRSGECVNTLEGHEDRVWALQAMSIPAINASTEGVDSEQGDASSVLVYSAGSDGRLVVWQDATKTEEKQRLQAAESALLSEQALQNDLRHARYSSALNKALHLQQPGKVLHVLGRILETKDVPKNKIAKKTDNSEDNEATTDMEVEEEEELDAATVEKSGFDGDWSKRLDKVLHDLLRLNEDDQTSHQQQILQQILTYAADWNTNTKNCYTTQLLLNSLLRVVRLPRLMTPQSGLTEQIQGLLAYTERHYQRVNRLAQASHLLDYLVTQVNGGLIPLETLQRQQVKPTANLVESVGIVPTIREESASSEKEGTKSESKGKKQKRAVVEDVKESGTAAVAVESSHKKKKARI